MWPDDGEPRFIVTSVTGYPVSPGGKTAGSERQSTAFQVLDRAYSYKLVREFLVYAARGGSESGRRAKADALAADLNAQDVAGLLNEDIEPLYEDAA